MHKPINILVIDGNTAEHNQRAIEMGIQPYRESYSALLETLGLETLVADVKTDQITPSELVPEKIDRGKLAAYDGFVWTGSPLHLYDESEAVRNQRAFASTVLHLGKPVFGSCWGLQINSDVLGGKIAANSKGIELCIARNILIHEAGRNHPLYRGKPPVFDALAIHVDEVITPPKGAVILASNPISGVQSMVIEQDGVDFWGVQYHPEFNFGVIAIILRRIAELLIEKKFFDSVESVHAMAKDYDRLLEVQTLPQSIEKSVLAFRYGITETIMDMACHQLELVNWLAHVRENANQ